MKQDFKHIVPLKDLNLTDRFLFDEVMEDAQTQQDFLSIIFGREIPLLSRAETEKELRVSPSVRSIRMDVFSMDEEKTIYNTEMQKKKQTDLAKRSRYYQSMIDTSLLKLGVPDYNDLNQSYVIMVTPFDLFGYGRYIYTFQAACREEPGCILQDGAFRIFLNTRGTNDDEISPELVSFLHYLENTTDTAADSSDSERIRRIHRRVRDVKQNEKVGVKYMQAWEERYYDKKEAREEGREEGLIDGQNLFLLNLVRKKLRNGQSCPEIAAALEQPEDKIRHIIEVIETHPETDDEELLEVL